MSYVLFKIACEEEGIYTSVINKGDDINVLHKLMKTEFIKFFNEFMSDTLTMDHIQLDIPIELSDLHIVIDEITIPVSMDNDLACIVEGSIIYTKDQISFDMVNVNARKRRYLYTIIKI